MKHSSLYQNNRLIKTLSLKSNGLSLLCITSYSLLKGVWLNWMRNIGIFHAISCACRQRNDMRDVRVMSMPIMFSPWRSRRMNIKAKWGAIWEKQHFQLYRWTIMLSSEVVKLKVGITIISLLIKTINFIIDIILK